MPEMPNPTAPFGAGPQGGDDGVSFCSSSVKAHLAKGAGAALSIGLAVAALPTLWPSLVLLPLALLLMRGCPMCWLVGLLQTIGNRKPAGDPG